MNPLFASLEGLAKAGLSMAAIGLIVAGVWLMVDKWLGKS